MWITDIERRSGEVSRHRWIPGTGGWTLPVLAPQPWKPISSYNTSSCNVIALWHVLGPIERCRMDHGALQGHCLLYIDNRCIRFGLGSATALFRSSSDITRDPEAIRPHMPWRATRGNLVRLVSATDLVVESLKVKIRRPSKLSSEGKEADPSSAQGRPSHTCTLPACKPRSALRVFVK